MKAELELQDIQAIADKVVEALKPRLSGIGKQDNNNDCLMNVKTLAEYMGVSAQLIYKFTENREIPHIKRGKKLLLFRKRDIDRWLDSFSVPILQPPDSLLRVVGQQTKHRIKYPTPRVKNNEKSYSSNSLSSGLYSSAETAFITEKSLDNAN
jgi:excisionase family DNA binding protein